MGEKNKYYIIFVLLIIIMFAIINNNKTKLKNENKSDTNEKLNNESVVEELSIYDDKVKKLYKFINDYDWGYFSEIGQGNFHKSIKIDLSHLTDKEKLLLLMHHSNNKVEADEIINIPDNPLEANVTQYIYDKNKMVNFGKNIFGPEFKIEKNFIFESNCGFRLKSEEEKIIYERYMGGCGGVRDFSSYKKLVKAEKDKENIYLYDKYLYLKSDYGVCGNFLKKPYTEIYDSYDRLNFITSMNQDHYLIKDILEEQKVNLEQENITKEEIEKIKELADKALIYKHTFKKNKKGNYYWISSEMIN